MNAFKITIGCVLAVTILGSCKKESVFRQKEKPELVIATGSERLSAPGIHFVKDTVYVLAADLWRHAGQELIIDAGTLVKVNNGVSINIEAGARLDVKGTSQAPVVFTSSAEKGQSGVSSNSETFAWNGISIGGATGAVPVSLTYVRIEFAGLYRSALELTDLEAGSAINNIQVSYSQNNPSFEFSGGNVNAEHLVSYASAATDFRVRNGYQGMLQQLLVYRHPYYAENPGAGGSLVGFLTEGAATFPAVSNLTVIGPDLQSGSKAIYNDTISKGFGNSVNGSRVAGLLAINNGRFHIRNAVLIGFPKGGFYIDSYGSAYSLHTGESEFSYSVVHSNDTARAFYLTPKVYPDYTSGDFKSYMLQPLFNNLFFSGSAAFMLADPYNYNAQPDPLPTNGSPLLSGASFDGPVFSDPFFKKVNYRGAFGTDNWLKEWTNFIPLQTSYNN